MVQSAEQVWPLAPLLWSTVEQRHHRTQWLAWSLPTERREEKEDRRGGRVGGGGEKMSENGGEKNEDRTRKKGKKEKERSSEKPNFNEVHTVINLFPNAPSIKIQNEPPPPSLPPSKPSHSSVQW